MIYFGALVLGMFVGGGTYFGLYSLGREIRTGMVEAAKVRAGESIETPKTED